MCRRTNVAALLCALLLAGCSQAARESGQPSSGDRPSTVAIAGTSFGDLVIGQPVSHGNLTIFPLSSKAPKEADRFITLDEGLAAGTVRVIEVGADGREIDEVQGGGQEDDPFATPPPPQAPLPEEVSEPESDVSAGAAGDADPFADPPVAAPVGEALAADGELPPSDEVADQPAPQQPAAEQTLTAEGDDPFADVPNQAAQSDSASVNTLLVLNTSEKPLYLMPGEVISGGQQDRTIGRELVIQPGEQPVPIDVFCVEHGRWSERPATQTTALVAEAIAYPDSEHWAMLAERAKQAKPGEFVASTGQLNKDVRLAVQYLKAQSDVWDKVDEVNASVGNEAATSNFSAAYADEDVAPKLKAYVESLTSIEETPQIVGVAVAVNGQMLSTDVFESTPLFRKFWRKLLGSYALDAVAAASEADEETAAVPACTVEDCLAFLQGIDHGEAATESMDDEQHVVRHEAAEAVGFSFYDRPATQTIESSVEPARGAGFGGAGFGAAGFGAAGYGGGGFGGAGGAVHAGGFAR